MIEMTETPKAASAEIASTTFSGVAPGCASHPVLFSGPMVRAILAGDKTQTRRILSPQPDYVDDIGGIALYGKNWDKVVKCPCGRKGDHLYVRESWWECVDNNDRIYYSATETPEDTNRRHYRKRPSIHMRRTDSRITLEVVDVRLERLTAISVGDAIAEGVGGTTSITPCYAQERFKTLWESINGPGSWDADPWVWAVSFRVV